MSAAAAVGVNSVLRPAKIVLTVALMIAIAFAAIILPRPSPAAAADTAVSVAVGGDVNRLGKTFIDATNTKFTALNYRKASASNRVGGSDRLRALRRAMTGWWYWDGKAVNEISANERSTILRDYWPGDGCTVCRIAGPTAKELLIANDYIPNAAFNAQRDREQAAMEQQNIAKAKADGIDVSGVTADAKRACTGTTKRVPKGVEYDHWFNSCDTDQQIRNYGYGREACGHVLTITTAGTAIGFLKNAASTKGVSAVGAVLGAACWALSTYNVQPIIDAKNRSDKAAVIMKVRAMEYQGKGSAYVTATTWSAQ